MTERTQLTWAISISSALGGRTFAGVLFWDEGPEHVRGLRSATFSTRREAREAMDDRFKRGGYARKSYKPRVERVRLTMEVLG